MRNWIMRILAAAAFMMLLCGSAAAETLPEYDYTWSGKTVKATYSSDTLIYKIERAKQDKTYIWVTKIWMADPGRQIKKATGVWRESLESPKKMMKTIEGCVLAINGSGYISSVFPTLEEGYPGESSDYYYTSLGSLAITNGELLRRMDEVGFYGLTLEEDGLHMWTGQDNETVLAGNPTQTWCFWHKCALIQDGKDILDRENWSFAQAHAARTIIGKVDQNNYILMTVERDGGSSHGMTLLECVDFLMENFQLEWAYNLDGGPSSALMCRKKPTGSLRVLYGGTSKDFDIMGFTE